MNEYEKHIGIIEINKLEKYNALDSKMKQNIVESLNAYAKNPDIKAIIIQGTPKAFCTGQDLSDPVLDNPNADFGQILVNEWAPIIDTIRNAPKIVIASVQGHCAGAGIMLAMACDLIYASADSKWNSAFTKVGLIPDCGSSFYWTQELGYYKAMEFALGLITLTGQQLFDYNIVSEVCVGPNKVAYEKAQHISTLDSLCIKHLKSNFQLAVKSHYKKALEAEIITQRELGFASAYQQAVLKFKKKKGT